MELIFSCATEIIVGLINGLFAIAVWYGILQKPDLASVEASEEDKVKAMMQQAGEDYDPSK